MKWILLSLSLFLALSSGSLVYVIEVFRHGIREPVYPYWNSLIVNADFGELTPPGMRQQCEPNSNERPLTSARFLSFRNRPEIT